MAFSHQRWDRDDFAFAPSLFDLDLELLPLLVAPIQDQLRVFVNGVEYKHDDGSDPNLTTKKWSFVPSSTIKGAAAVQLRILTFSQINSNAAGFSEIMFDDVDGNEIIQIGSRWTGPNQPESGTLSDKDGTFTRAMGLADNIYDFSGRISFKEIHLGAASIDLGGEPPSRLAVALNIGTLAKPNFVDIIDEDTSPTPTSFPISAGPGNPIPWVVADKAVKTVAYTGPDTTLPPRIKITPALDKTSDYVVLLRETRQDEPWVDLVPGAPARSFTMDTYWRQLLFIAQELCEYKDVGPSLGLGPASDTDRNFALGDQQQLHLNHATATVYSYSKIELLVGVPGAPSNPSSQIVVEIGDKTDGTSTAWTTVNEETTPADKFDFDIQAGAETITLGATTDRDIRIRRVTKIDELWLTLSDPTSWSSAQIILNQKQIRFLFEESCLFPRVYKESPLASSIFPRAWNWLNYKGDDSIFFFGGPFWGGDGIVVVFVNDVLQTEGVDYTINPLNFSIDFTSLLTKSDNVDIGSSGGGFDGGGNIGGGDIGPLDGGTDSKNSTPTPKAPATTIDFPPRILTKRGIEISIGAVSKAVMLTPGALEGGGTLASFALLGAIFNNHAIRIQTTVNISNTVPDGAGGFLPVGATAVAYAHGHCFTESNPLPRLYYVYHAQDLDGDGTFTSVVTSVTGCIDPDGTGGGEAVVMWDRWKGTGIKIGSGDDINLRLFNSLQNMAANGISTPADVLFFNRWADLATRSQEADNAGIVTESGFTDAQWRDHLDPFTTLSDFDIP